MTSPNIHTPLPRRSLLKIPVQPRSVNMVHNILDAANIVVARDLKSLTMNHVAEIAGISVGSLYQYFSNKESLIDGMIERTVLQAEVVFKQFYFQGRDQSLHEYLNTIFYFMLHWLDAEQQTTVNVIQSVPLLAENSFVHQVETMLHDAIHTYLVHNGGRYCLKNGNAGLYVAINSTIYLYFKWIIDYVKPCTEEVFIQLVLEQIMQHIDHVGIEQIA